MTAKNLGIWMDHSSANLIDLNSKREKQSITSQFTFEVRGEALSRSENLMHNKERQMQEAYYKEIADEILNYDHVLLFGPTHAKSELHNYLNEQMHFKHVKVDVESADEMTENEKTAYVKSHFDD